MTASGTTETNRAAESGRVAAPAAGSTTPQDCTEQNREALVAFFRERPEGIAPSPDARVRSGASVPGMLGVEVEHFVVFDDGSPVPYWPRDGRIGILDVLEELEGFCPGREHTTEGRLIGLSGEEGTITLEPAAQLEFSMRPYATVGQVAAAYDRFRARVDPYLADAGAHIVNCGYHPTRRAFDLELIPKTRYRYMNDYFTQHIHSHGERMMRASASTQVSVDFSDEADGVRKLRVGSALAPVLSAICDNAPVFEAAPNTQPLRRFSLWRSVDDARCGVIPGIFDDGFSFESYADWLLGTCPIFVTRPAADDPEGPSTRAVYGLTAAEAYADAPLSEADMVQLGSMFWPDVRLKKFIEIRPGDCMPREQILGYTALIKGLFYSEESLGAVEGRLGVVDGRWPLEASDVDASVEQIETHGLAGRVYGEPLDEWEAFLFGLARAALASDEAGYLDALEEFAAEKPWWRVEA